MTIILRNQITGHELSFSPNSPEMGIAREMGYAIERYVFPTIGRKVANDSAREFAASMWATAYLAPNDAAARHL